MAENAESQQKQTTVAINSKHCLKQLLKQNAFWDELLADSEKDNFHCLTRSFAKCEGAENSVEILPKTDDKYAELEDSLKYLVSLLTGYDDRITATVTQLQKLVNDISLS